MRKLHLKFYLAIVVTLMVFLASGTMLWHHFSSPQVAVQGIESATALAVRLIEDARDDEQQRHVIHSLARQLRADITLYAASGVPLQREGDAPPLTRDEMTGYGWFMRRGGPVLNWQLVDGRHLVVRPRHGFVKHGLHVGMMLTTIAATLALLTYPITRGITARLARLQAGVLQFGAGNLAARVRVEGRDEVAMLAQSFNEAAARIEKLMRAHQLLVANCSHELRTPLARIRLSLERVPDTDANVSAELTRNIAELDALIGEVLLSSRLDMASGLERSEPVDLLALAAEEAAHFDLQAGGDPVMLNGDPMLLRRLVRNLLDNARQHAGGAIEVRIERDERYARIVIDDAGGGVAAEDHERIFEPFYRSKTRASPATQSTGSGLGLAIVRQIAHAHGGSVQYASRAGGGSRFIATLPLR